MSKIIKIAVLGPESTGKSELVVKLAKYFNTSFAVEIARDYIMQIKKSYDYQDYIKMLHLQIKAENTAIENANKITFFDTEMINFEVWHDYKYGKINKELKGILDSRKYDFYLLCYYDIAWEKDIIRENPDIRDELFNVYKRKVEEKEIPFEVIKGVGEKRTLNAIKAVDNYLKSR